MLQGDFLHDELLNELRNLNAQRQILVRIPVTSNASNAFLEFAVDKVCHRHCRLHHVISSKQELSDDHVQYFLYQLIAGAAASMKSALHPGGGRCP